MWNLVARERAAQIGNGRRGIVCRLLLLAGLFAALPVAAYFPFKDYTFGLRGTMRLGTLVGSPAHYTENVVSNLLVEPAGRILLTGHATDRGPYEWVLARLLGDGAVDHSFGDGGRIYPKPYHCDGALRTIEQPGGAIVIVAGAGGGSFCQFFQSTTALRFAPDGAAGASFKPSLATGAIMSDVALGVRPDGHLLYGVTRGLQSTALLQQVLPDGAPDPSFGVNGEVTFAESGASRAHDLAILPDGSAVFARLTASELILYMVDASGAKVSDFGNAGRFELAMTDIAVGLFGRPLITLLALKDGTFFVGVSWSSDIAGGGFMGGLRIVRVSATGALLYASDLFGKENIYQQWNFVALPDASVLIGRSLRAASFSTNVLYRFLPDNRFGGLGATGSSQFSEVRTIDAMALDNADRLLIAGQDDSGALLARYSIRSIAANNAMVVEFYNPALQHYFVTGEPVEAAAIDGGAAGPGWQRTGKGFGSGGVSLVCRFYGNTNPNPVTGAIYGPNSHFYTADPRECAGLRSLYTPAGKSWKFESYDFSTSLPDFAANDRTTCRAGTMPVYRAYNNGFARGIDSNHRLTSDFAAYQQTVATGWIGEGIAMCAPE